MFQKISLFSLVRKAYLLNLKLISFPRKKAIYFTNNKEGLTKVLDKIKEKSLIQEFDYMLEKTGELKNVFISFIDSFAIPVNKLSNMLAYAFLIPILPELYEMSQGFGEHDVMELFKRILYFVGVSVSGVFLKNLLLSIVNRFKT